MTKRDPYADVFEVYAAETSRARAPKHQPTPKTPTEGSEDAAASPDWFYLVAPEEQTGFHIDGDKRYQER